MFFSRQNNMQDRFEGVYPEINKDVKRQWYEEENKLKIGILFLFFLALFQIIESITLTYIALFL